MGLWIYITLINADTGDELELSSNSWFNYAKTMQTTNWMGATFVIYLLEITVEIKESVAVNSDANPDVLDVGSYLIIYTIAAPPELVIDGNKTDISCFGAADGSIDLSVAGGATNYTYSWTTANGSGLVATDQDQSGLGPGTYNVTVTDAKNCTQSTSFTITQPAQLAIELDNSVATQLIALIIIVKQILRYPHRLHLLMFCLEQITMEITLISLVEQKMN